VLKIFNRNIVFSITVILLSVGAYFYINELSPESKIFPQVVCIVLIFFNLLNIVKNIKISSQEKIFVNVDFNRLITMAAGILAYILLMRNLGFVISSLIFLTFFTWFLNYDRKKRPKTILLKSFIFSVIIILTFFSIFHYIFLIPLP
jgi:hypothetical protein